MDTLRELYLKSGNQCAFLGCTRIMIDNSGVFVGQVCHIEAAEVGGERFNPDQTNEDRRNFENLMLMCYDHHQVTNNVEEYSVNDLKAMKATHEQKYGDVAQKLRNSIADYTEASMVTDATNLGKICDTLNWNLTQDELDVSLLELSGLCEVIKKLPVPTRELLVVIIKRAEHLPGYNFTMSCSLGISISELAHACLLDDHSLNQHLHMLDRYGLIIEGDPDDFNGLSGLQLRKLKSGWDIWSDLKQYADSGAATLHSLIVELDFSSLDRSEG